MLSPHDEDEEDDDSHLCIKCNITIVGLDNYVRHRKQRCGKEKNSAKVLPIDPLEPTYGLGADFFFQSLELQSSVKKSSLSRLTPPVTISKPGIDNQNSLQVATTSRDIPRISPLEGNLRGEDWIGGHSLKIGGNEDNQTKLIKAVASISGAVKKDIPTSSYNIGPFNDFKPDDDSDELEDLEDDEEEDHASKWKPPPTYTGGKWRPYSPENEEWDIREEQEHTGGKWKASCTPDRQERDEDYDAPPPGHTKGKWLPGANEKTQIMQTTIQNRGSVQYWCGPCNRRLGSRTIYEKHLKSNLHRRKVLPEHDLEYSGHLRPIPNTLNKRMSRPSRYLNETMYLQPPQKKTTEVKPRNQNTPKLKIKMKKKKRNRNPIYIQCPGCKSRVRTHLMGKHLISHYHFRKVSDTKSDVYQQLILDYMDAIVHQSPFQCSPCKFYTNWLSNIMQHFYSDEHAQKVASIEGRFWCSFCKFECDTSESMLNHLSSSEHGDVVAAINRSMPIIIRKKTVFHCETCNEEFRYNIAIKQHCKETNHKMAYTATDLYQQLNTCAYCDQKFKSSLTLAAHLKSKHKQNAYLCIICSKSFNSSQEAKIHRHSSEHRVSARKERLHKLGLPTTDLRKKCPYCTEKVTLATVLELKEHIRKVHPNIKKKCPQCGKSFIFSQEVSRHIRDGVCKTKKPESVKGAILWSCNLCSYTTDSQAECFFHETLHSDPITEIRDSGESKTILKKYKCPFCAKTFKKSSLRDHLRQHTFERPFACSICGANFTRQSSLANHSKSEHQHDAELPEPPMSEVENDEAQEYRCAKCNRRFINGLALSQHKALCVSDAGVERRCSYEGCTYVAASYAQLIRHNASHGDRKKHKCSLCNFKTDQASHYKRHMICHEGTKPYACPYCEFSCASLENLRKHVIKTRHPGNRLYRCRHCPFGVDMAAAFRAHYVTAHADLYDSRTAMKAVKEHLLGPQIT